MQQKNCLNNNEFDKYKFLAVNIANRYKSYNIELQDIIQAAFLGLTIGLNRNTHKDEKHKVNYLSKYILGEIISTLKSYNNYIYHKDYFKTVKIIEENKELTINSLVDKFNLSKNLVIDILTKEHKEEIIDNNNYYLNEEQNKIYDNIVNLNYSVTKTAKILKKKREYILLQLKEIYNIIKK